MELRQVGRTRPSSHSVRPWEGQIGHSTEVRPAPILRVPLRVRNLNLVDNADARATPVDWGTRARRFLSELAAALLCTRTEI